MVCCTPGVDDCPLLSEGQPCPDGGGVPSQGQCEEGLLCGRSVAGLEGLSFECCSALLQPGDDGFTYYNGGNDVCA